MHAARVICPALVSTTRSPTPTQEPRREERSAHRHVDPRAAERDAVPVRVRDRHRVRVDRPDLRGVVRARLDEQRLRRGARHDAARGHAPVAVRDLPRVPRARAVERGDVARGAVARQCCDERRAGVATLGCEDERGVWGRGSVGESPSFLGLIEAGRTLSGEEMSGDALGDGIGGNEAGRERERRGSESKEGLHDIVRKREVW